MKISMSTAANYVTRQTLFDNQTFGLLTDRQIERYRQMGKYGPVAPKAQLRKRKRSPSTIRYQTLLQSILA